MSKAIGLGPASQPEFLRKFDLRGRGAIVTGGSEGIGRAIVITLLELGASVVTCGRSVDKLAKLEAEIGPSADLKCISLDMAEPRARDELVAQALAWFRSRTAGRTVALSILVNNVGTNIRKPTESYTAIEVDTLLRTNFVSMVHLCQLCKGPLSAAASARDATSAIVNISSVSGGPTCTQTGSIYAATKAAMNHFTKSIGCEWAPDGIRVNSVAPWYIRTPLADQVLEDPTYHDTVMTRTPFRRIGEPAEVADTTAYLVSDAASYVTGTLLHVDGGFSSSGFGYFPSFAIPTLQKNAKL